MGKVGNLYRLACMGASICAAFMLNSCSEGDTSGFAQLEEQEFMQPATRKPAFDPDNPVSLPVEITSWAPQDELIILGQYESALFDIQLSSGGDPTVEYTFALPNAELARSKKSVMNLTGEVFEQGVQELTVTASNAVGQDSHTFLVKRNTPPQLESRLPVEKEILIECTNGISIFKGEFSDAEDHVLTFSWTLDGEPIDEDIVVATEGKKSQLILQNSCEDLSKNNVLKLLVNDGHDTVTQTWVYSVNDPNAQTGELGNSAIKFNPSTFDFGYMEAYVGRENKTITAKNTSQYDIYISEFRGETESYTLSDNTCSYAPLPLAVGAECSFTINFRPQTPGLSTMNIQIVYGATPDSTELQSIMSVTGTGVSPLTFAGISSIDNVTHNKVRLKWPETSDASSFLVFQVAGNGDLVYKKTIVNTNGNVTSAEVTSLQPSSTYSFRIRAVDALGNQDTNTKDESVEMLANNSPLLPAISPPAIYTGISMTAIDVNDVNTSADRDIDGDVLSYTCRYDKSANGTVGAGLGKCDELVNLDGSTASFSATTGGIGNWVPPHASAGETYELEIVASDPYGATSSSVFAVTIAAGTPATPVMQTISPSPSNLNNPTVTGLAEPNMIITLYVGGSSCETVVGTGTTDGDGNFSIAATVIDNRLHTIRGTTTNEIGNESTCSPTSLTYIEDSAPPAPLIVTGTNPPIETSLETIAVLGQSESSVTIRIFSDATCDTLVNSGMTNGSGNFSIPVTVPAGTTATFWAEAEDDVGNTSDCSLSSATYSSYAIGEHIAWLTGNRTTQSDQLNLSTPYAVQWTNSAYDYNYFDHDTSSDSERLLVKQDGDYFVSLTVPLVMTGGTYRPAVKAQFFVNNIAVQGSVGESSYIRNDSGHLESTIHVAVLLPDLSSNDLITVKLEGTAGTGNEVVEASANISLMAEFIGAGRAVFAASGNGTTSGTNLNTASDSPLEWTTQQRTNNDAFEQNSDHEITLKRGGDYLLTINVPTYSATQRASVRVKVKIDGVTIPGGIAQQGYTRADSDHFDASVHWAGLVRDVPAGGILTIETSVGGAPGTVTVQGSNLATLFVEEIDTSSDVFAASATTLTGGDDWNPSTAQNILWSQQDAIDESLFSHNPSTDSDQITIDSSGDYLLIYSDVLWSSVQRAAPKITVAIDGVAVNGAEVKTHYIRSISGHNSSSGSLVFLLRNVGAGSVLTLKTVAEAATGTVNDDAPALITLIRRP